MSGHFCSHFLGCHTMLPWGRPLHDISKVHADVTTLFQLLLRVVAYNCVQLCQMVHVTMRCGYQKESLHFLLFSQNISTAPTIPTLCLVDSKMHSLGFSLCINFKGFVSKVVLEIIIIATPKSSSYSKCLEVINCIYITHTWQVSIC